MRQLFISYARENRPDVDELVRDLEALGYPAWVDSSLRGGQTWWEEILRRIAECDAFVVIVSQHTLHSVACRRELEWALALKKAVLPLAVERLPDALPRTLSMRQIVNYSKSGREAAFALAGALRPCRQRRPYPISYRNRRQRRCPISPTWWTGYHSRMPSTTNSSAGSSFNWSPRCARWIPRSDEAGATSWKGSEAATTCTPTWSEP